MANIFTYKFQQETGIDLSRVRPDFRDEVKVALLNHLRDGVSLKNFKPLKLTSGSKVVGGSLKVLCQGAYKYFDEGVVEDLLKMSGGKRPSAGPGEILLTTLFGNVAFAKKGDITIDGKTCEIKSIRGGGGPYDRSALLDKLKVWEKNHGQNLDDVEWNPSGIGALIPHLKEMDDEAIADLAPLLAGEAMANTVFKELKKAESNGGKILLGHLGACQMKNYCDKENMADLLIIFPEDDKYLFLPNGKILEVCNYVKFGGWGQFGFMISKLNLG